MSGVMLVGLGIERVCNRHTDVGTDVARAKCLDGKVWLDLANEEGSISICEVSFLFFFFACLSFLAGWRD